MKDEYSWDPHTCFQPFSVSLVCILADFKRRAQGDRVLSSYNFFHFSTKRPAITSFLGNNGAQPPWMWNSQLWLDGWPACARFGGACLPLGRFLVSRRPGKTLVFGHNGTC